VTAGRRLALRFAARTLALSWGLCGLALLATASASGKAFTPSWVLIAAACAPSAAALTLLPAADIRMRLAPRFDTGGLLCLAAVLAVGAGASLWGGARVPAFHGLWPLALVAPFGEELGWRGLLLPLVLRRNAPWLAGLLTGAAWIVWHLPAFFVPGAMAQASPLWWCVGTAALSVVMAQTFVRGGGSAVGAGFVPHLLVNGLGVLGLWSYTPIQAASLSGAALLLSLTGPGKEDKAGVPPPTQPRPAR